MNINVNEIFKESYNRVVKATTNYVAIMVNNGITVIYAELQESFRMTWYSSYDDGESFVLRLPIEVCNSIMNASIWELETVTNNDVEFYEIKAKNSTGEVLANIKVVKEVCDLEIQINNVLTGVKEASRRWELTNPKIFRHALKLTKPSSKETAIKGVSFNDGLCFTLANGYAAYVMDKDNLLLTLATSTLKSLVEFVGEYKNVEIVNNKGYNYCVIETEVFGWRRVRTTESLTVPELTYNCSYILPAVRVNNILNSIKSDIKELRISPSSGSLIIQSQIGKYDIPIFTPVPEVGDIYLSHKVFKSIIGIFKKDITVKHNAQTLEITDGNVHCYMGVTV